MKIHIEVYYSVNAIGVLNKGTFRIDKDEVTTACNFIRRLQKEYPYDLLLEKVIVNGDRDIVEEVREKLKPPLI